MYSDDITMSFATQSDICAICHFTLIFSHNTYRHSWTGQYTDTVPHISSSVCCQVDSVTIGVDLSEESSQEPTIR